MGDCQQLIKTAWQIIGKQPGYLCLALSSPYETEPIGMVSNNKFINAVGALEVKGQVHDFLTFLLKLELTMGRDRASGKDRTIDLDILYYDDLILQEATLVLPHPELHKRLFVLEPLTEIAPDHLHPLFQKSSQQLLQNLAREYQCQKTSWN